MAVTLKTWWLNFGEYALMQPICLCHQTYLEFPVVQVWYITVCVRVSPFQSPCAYACVFLPSLNTILNFRTQSDYNSQGSGLKENLGQRPWEMSVRP